MKGKKSLFKKCGKKIFLCFNDDELVRKKISLLFLHSVKINPIMRALYYFFYKRKKNSLLVQQWEMSPSICCGGSKEKKKRKNHLSAAVVIMVMINTCLQKSRQCSLLLYFIVPLNDLTSHPTFVRISRRGSVSINKY